MLRRPPTRIELSIDDKDEYLEAKRLAALSDVGGKPGVHGLRAEDGGRTHQAADIGLKRGIQNK